MALPPNPVVRLKRDPDYWELRAYAGRDPISGRPRYVSRSFRGGKRDAGKALTQFVAEIDVKGTQADLSVVDSSARSARRTSTTSTTVFDREVCHPPPCSDTTHCSVARSSRR
jgi:hypothetical protein